MGQTRVRMWTSLKPDSDANRSLIFRAALGGDGAIFDMTDVEIRAAHLMITPASKVDEKTGEEIPLVRVAVITADGKVYDGFGAGLQKSVEFLIAIYGEPPWKNPISLQVRRIKTGQGHTMALEPWVAKPAGPERRR